jgi:hypothetical protein
MAQLPEQWFDLTKLGFPGWEHTPAYRVTTNAPHGGWRPHYLDVRIIGSDFPVRLFDDGRGIFEVIRGHIEGVEALIAKQDARTAAEQAA